MKKYFAIGFLIIIVIFFISTCNKTNHLLPEKYNTSTKSSFGTGLSYVRIIKIDGNIRIKDLDDYPLGYRASIIRRKRKPLTKWTKLDSLDNKKATISNLRKTLNFGDYNEIEELLNQIEENHNSIYFAGHGQIMLGRNNEKVNHYQYKYFLNLKTNEIFEFDMIY